MLNEVVLLCKIDKCKLMNKEVIRRAELEEIKSFLDKNDKLMNAIFRANKSLIILLFNFVKSECC